MPQKTENILNQAIDDKSVETSLTILRARADGIIEIRFKTNEYEVDVADQLEIHDAFAKLTNNGSTSCSLLVIPGLYGGITKEAREKEMFSFPVYRNQKALAIVVHALHQRILGTMYIALKKNKPNYPYKFFSTEQQATKWILSLPKS